MKCFTCDAPAHQFVKGIKSHTGYNGCERCQVIGQYISSMVVYHKTDASPRTDPEFKHMIYNDHQVSESSLIKLDINLISDSALDYMHLVCLGVTKRLLLFLKEGPRCCRMSPSQINQVSERLECNKAQFPSEMARQPMGLSKIKRWKATELRQFLLYSGIVVLKGIVTDQFYYHFLSLSIAIRIVLESDSEIRQNNLVYAKKLAMYFVQKSIELYGPSFCTYNVHNLIHLHEDVEHFKEDLHSISCFKFENHFQALKNMYVNQQIHLLKW